MKTKTVMFFYILCLAVVIIFGSCATKQIAISHEEAVEAFSGTWTNPDYDETWRYSKVIINSDGTWIEYKMCNDDRPILIGEYNITEKWIDTDGYIFYKIIVTRTDREYVPYYLIARIDKTGNVYEDLWTTAHMPTEFDPDNVLYNYRIYYRQE